jgi:hypothetical protein
MAEQRGRTVRVAFAGTLAAGTSVALPIFDTDGKAYTLSPQSQLVLYALLSDLPTGLSLDLITTAAGATATTSANLLLSFDSVSGEWHAHGEGMSGLRGIVPSLLVTGGGGTTTFKISGEAIVLEYLSQLRPTQEPAVGGAAM